MFYRFIHISGFIPILFFIFFSSIISGYAETPFRVTKIFVQAVSDSPLKAQQEAMIRGQRIATEKLIERITLEKERKDTGFRGVSAKTAAELVSSVDVEREKRSQSRYLSEISVNFNPSAVKKFLESQNLTLISDQSPTRLVIPVLKTDQKRALWQETEWQKAWENLDFRHELTPVISVLDTEKAANLLTMEQVFSGKAEVFYDLAKAYSVKWILLAVLEPYGEEKYRVHLTDIAPFWDETHIYKDVEVSNLKQAPEKIINLLQKQWKQQQSRYNKHHQPLDITVYYDSAEEWIALKKILMKSAIIDTLSLKAIAYNRAYLTLLIKGDFQVLQHELASHGLEAYEDEQYGYIVRR